MKFHRQRRYPMFAGRVKPQNLNISIALALHNFVQGKLATKNSEQKKPGPAGKELILLINDFSQARKPFFAYYPDVWFYSKLIAPNPRNGM